ncbi:MAG: tetratricopeptide repeat protein [Chitinophagales bacterium]
MLEEERDDNFGEMMDLIRRYEEAEEHNQPLLLEEEAYERIVEFYLENREYKRALHVAECALEIYPYAVELWIQKAAILTEQNKFDEALELLKHAESLDRNEVPIYLLRADIYLAQGKHSHALEMVEDGLEIASDPEDQADLLLERADVYEDMGLYLKVIESLKEVLKLMPLNEEALSRIWFTAELTETFEDSRIFHQQHVDENPYSQLGWFNLGHAFLGLKRYDDAIEALSYAIAIDENFEAAYVMMGDAYAEQLKHQEALECFLDALKLAKPNKETFCKTGECYAQIGDYHKARIYFRKAIAIDPSYDDAFFLVGETYRAEENFEKAVQAYSRAVKIAPDNLEYLNALGDAYIMNEQVEEAVRIFEQVILLDQKIKQHYINLATAYYGMENFSACMDTMREGIRQFPEDADLYYIQFVFYHQIKNRHEAMLSLERALLLDFSQHPIIFEMEPELLNDPTVTQIIEQYRS